jgi:hypothetical protein
MDRVNSDTPIQHGAPLLVRDRIESRGAVVLAIGDVDS